MRSRLRGSLPAEENEEFSRTTVKTKRPSLSAERAAQHAPRHSHPHVGQQLRRGCSEALVKNLALRRTNRATRQRASVGRGRWKLRTQMTRHRSAVLKTVALYRSATPPPLCWERLTTARLYSPQAEQRRAFAFSPRPPASWSSGEATTLLRHHLNLRRHDLGPISGAVKWLTYTRRTLIVDGSLALVLRRLLTKRPGGSNE